MPGSSPPTARSSPAPPTHAILRGITRDVLIGAIAAQGLTLEERPFTVAEALAAREAFLTSASQIVMPV